MRTVILTREIRTITYPYPFPAGTRVALVSKCGDRDVYEGFASTGKLWQDGEMDTVLIAVPGDAFKELDEK